MKTQTSTATQSTLQQDTVPCEFDADGTAHLMSILSNIYRDAYGATLREYAANARDSHIEAGNASPIEITLPTVWEPTLTVCDYGSGLSRDALITVYSRYGKSTKRDTNEQVGAFGIGAKSAFTIATQFTVTAIKDGQRTLALFSLNHDGVPTVTVLAEEVTPDPDGVTIAIPVDDVEAMNRAADRIFSTWEPGTVLVNGEPPSDALSGMLRVTDDVYASSSVYAETSPNLSLIMGGVAYPASEAMLELAQRDVSDPDVLEVFEHLTARRRLSIAARVPLGSVDITPSREDLRDTPRTIAMLRKVVEQHVGNVAAAVGRDIDQQHTATQAAIRLAELKGFLSSLHKGFAWRGRHLPYEVVLPHAAIDLRASTGRAKRSFMEDSYTFHLGQRFDHILVITNVSDREVGGIRRLATRYLTNNDDITQLILVPDSSGTSEWVTYGTDDSALSTISCEDFKKTAKALPATSTGRREVAYCTYRNGKSQRLTGPEITDRATRVIAHRGPRKHLGPLLDLTLEPDDILVLLEGPQTMKALERRVGDVLQAKDLVTRKAAEIIAEATDLEAKALTFADNIYMDVIVDHQDEITIDHLSRMAAAYAEARTAANQVPSDRMRLLRHADAFLEDNANRAEYDLSAYPLFQLTVDEARRRWKWNESEKQRLLRHAVLYVNAVGARNSADQTCTPANAVAA